MIRYHDIVPGALVTCERDDELRDKADRILYRCYDVGAGVLSGRLDWLEANDTVLVLTRVCGTRKNLDIALVVHPRHGLTWIYVTHSGMGLRTDIDDVKVIPGLRLL